MSTVQCFFPDFSEEFQLLKNHQKLYKCGLVRYQYMKKRDKIVDFCLGFFAAYGAQSVILLIILPFASLARYSYSLWDFFLEPVLAISALILPLVLIIIGVIYFWKKRKIISYGMISSLVLQLFVKMIPFILYKY